MQCTCRVPRAGACAHHVPPLTQLEPALQPPPQRDGVGRADAAADEVSARLGRIKQLRHSCRVLVHACAWTWGEGSWWCNSSPQQSARQRRSPPPHPPNPPTHHPRPPGAPPHLARLWWGRQIHTGCCKTLATTARSRSTGLTRSPCGRARRLWPCCARQPCIDAVFTAAPRAPRHSHLRMAACTCSSWCTGSAAAGVACSSSAAAAVAAAAASDTWSCCCRQAWVLVLLRAAAGLVVCWGPAARASLLLQWLACIVLAAGAHSLAFVVEAVVASVQRGGAVGQCAAVCVATAGGPPAAGRRRHPRF